MLDAEKADFQRAIESDSPLLQKENRNSSNWSDDSDVKKMSGIHITPFVDGSYLVS